MAKEIPIYKQQASKLEMEKLVKGTSGTLTTNFQRTEADAIKENVPVGHRHPEADWENITYIEGE